MTEDSLLLLSDNLNKMKRIDPQKISDEEKQKQIEEMWKKHEQREQEPDFKFTFLEDEEEDYDY